MQTLQTQRLVLRDWTLDDLESFYNYSKNPNVGPNAGWPPHQSMDESEKILRRFMEQQECWAIALKEKPGAVGSLGIHRDTKRDSVSTKMIGYVLAEEHWNRGLMTEAVRRVLRYLFDETDTLQVTFYHYDFNQRSRRVIQKCGFQYEGTLRQASVLPDGTLCGDVCYSITKEEYLALNEKS
ncbi:MAG: GNAT family protein [Eubacteriales bacterium]|nr:GNAT family protein [Eubacteriales bacterium]